MRAIETLNRSPRQVNLDGSCFVHARLSIMMRASSSCCEMSGQAALMVLLLWIYMIWQRFGVVLVRRDKTLRLAKQEPLP